MLFVDGKYIVIVGGGFIGLIIVYYMVLVVKLSIKIIFYEVNFRFGGWIWMDFVLVNVGGKKGIVNFECGFRFLLSLIKNIFWFDDFVFYDLVWVGRCYLLVKLNVDVVLLIVYLIWFLILGCFEFILIFFLFWLFCFCIYFDFLVYFGIYEWRILVEDYIGCCFWLF